MVVGTAIMHASDGPSGALRSTGGMTTPVRVRARFSVDVDNTCEFNIRASAYKPHYHCYLLAVCIDPRTMALARAWLVPMNALPVVAAMKDGKYVLTASMAEKASDKAASYCHYSVERLLPVSPRRYQFRNNGLRERRAAPLGDDRG